MYLKLLALFFIVFGGWDLLLTCETRHAYNELLLSQEVIGKLKFENNIFCSKICYSELELREV